jgi:DnaK suppressor protein
VGDALSAGQLAALRAALERARGEVESSVAGSAVGAKPVYVGLAIGRRSRVDSLQQQKMARARPRRAKLQLQLIGAAIARQDRDYGTCLACGEPIGYARLRARPEAEVCRDCQSGDVD